MQTTFLGMSSLPPFFTPDVTTPGMATVRLHKAPISRSEPVLSPSSRSHQLNGSERQLPHWTASAPSILCPSPWSLLQITFAKTLSSLGQAIFNFKAPEIGCTGQNQIATF